MGDGQISDLDALCLKYSKVTQVAIVGVFTRQKLASNLGWNDEFALQ